MGVAYSHERDYISRAGVIELRTWTADRNRTYAFSVSFASSADHIGTENGAAENERKTVLDFLVGETQALSPTSIVQSDLTYSHGRGYFTDPYKLLDSRPDRRRLLAWLTRCTSTTRAWTLRCSSLTNIWTIRSVPIRLLEAAWMQPSVRIWRAPNLRYYSQAPRRFLPAPIGKGFVPGEPYTARARLSCIRLVDARHPTLRRLFPEG